MVFSKALKHEIIMRVLRLRRGLGVVNGSGACSHILSIAPVKEGAMKFRTDIADPESR